MARTNVLTTRVGIWFGGRLAKEDWLARRLCLMQEVAIPAFEQLESDWEWVWMTCKEREDQVREMAPGYVHIALQLDTPWGFWGTVDDIPGNEFLVARLDSDDAYLPTALDDAASKEWEPNSWIDWFKGWRWDVRPEFGERFAEAYWPKRRTGHFLAVTQESRDLMLHSGGDHSQILSTGRDRHMINQPSFLQIIHGENVGSGWGNPSIIENRDEVLSLFNVSANEVFKCLNEQ